MSAARPSLSYPPARGNVRGWGYGDVEMARELGRIHQRGKGWQVEVWDDGTRHRIGRAPIGGHWTALRTRDLAEMVLSAIRSEVASGASIEQAVAPSKPGALARILCSLRRLRRRNVDPERHQAASTPDAPDALRRLHDAPPSSPTART